MRRKGQVALVIAVTVASLPGCSAPAIEGYQIQAPPNGFIFDANSRQGRKIFPEREVLSEGAWWGDIRSDFAGLPTAKTDSSAAQ